MNGDSNTLEISQQIPPPPKGAVPISMAMPAAQPGAGDPFQPRDALINSVIHRESGGNPKARGKAGEIGLMQILPSTAAQYGVTPDQLADPNINRQLGTRILSDNLKRFKGNEYLAVMAYNSGPERVAKGIFLPQSSKYATDVLTNAGMGGVPQMEAQPNMPQVQEAMAMPAGQPGAGQAPVPPPGLLARMGSALSGALEGTAEAEEPPPPPPGAVPIGGTPAPPSGTISVNTPPPSPIAGMGPMKPTLRMGSTGASMTLTPQPPVKPPAQMLGQQLSADIALKQINQAAGWYDEHLASREHEFSGSLLTKEGRRGFVQPFEAQNSRYAQALGLGERKGGQGDKDVETFYDMVGPAIANQMKALIGGRLGYYMVNQSQLTPHLPNIDKDSLPRMRDKLDDLQKHTIPLVVNEINKFRAQGMTDDQIIQQMGGNPNSVPVNPDAPDQLPSGFVPEQ